MKNVIVGGVAGGASAAARLRRLNEEDDIIMFEKGNYISYANCGLPYHIGGVIKSHDKLLVQTPKAFYERFRVDVRVNHEVTAIDIKTKELTVKNHLDGSVYAETYDNLILAPGASPVIPEFVEDKNDRRFFTLNDIPDMDDIIALIEANEAKKAVVIGGGFIGLEVAENLNAIGVTVDLIELSDHIIASADWDMATFAAKEMIKNGIHLHLGEAVSEVKSETDAIRVVTDKAEYKTDFVICAIGVRPSTSFLAGSGITLDERGAILVDETMQTNVPHVYAVGDAVKIKHFVNGKSVHIPLAGPANKQGRIAADQIAGKNTTYKGTQGSSVLKICGKTFAMTGLNEKQAENYEKVYVPVKSHAGYYPGAENIWIKLIFDKDSGKVLGAQAFGGAGVDKRIDIIATAIRAHMTVYDLTELELCYAPPYGSAKDPVNMVAYAAENVLEGNIKICHYYDIDKIDPQKEVLLDVRKQKEYDAGHVEGSILIPLDELRDRLDEVPKDKKVFVMCAAGLRSYIAYRILTQKGYDCVSVSGGFNLYHAMKG